MVHCPECGERLVFVAIPIAGVIFKSWHCDCQYRAEEDKVVPFGIIADIMRSREWDDGSLCYEPRFE